MKERRRLEVGEKVEVVDIDGLIYEGQIKSQNEKYPMMYTVLDSLGTTAQIHRLQVIKTFRKVKKKPQILWLCGDAVAAMKVERSVTLGKVTNFAEHFVPTRVNQLNPSVPVRPLTDKERKKWGV